ncbi:MAG: DoxX family protein [Propionibacteriaceae bacterium]
MSKFLSFVRGLVLLIARLGLGATLIAHGYRRWQTFGAQSQIDFLTRSGIPQPRVFAYGSIVLELVGGLLLVVGLLTPLVAAFVVAEQALIIAWTNWNRIFLTNDAGQYVGGFEYNAVLGLLALIFVVFGAGPAALDRLFRRSKETDPELETGRSGASRPTGTTNRVSAGAGAH